MDFSASLKSEVGGVHLTIWYTRRFYCSTRAPENDQMLQTHYCILLVHEVDEL